MVAGRDARVSVASAAEFPVLEKLVGRTTGTNKVLAEIAKLPRLRDLQFGPATERGLALFDGLPLAKVCKALAKKKVKVETELFA